MSYLSSGLTIGSLQEANVERLPEFRDATGRLSHPYIEGQPVGFDWSLPEWTNAMCGEAGEAANIAKKIRRGDFSNAVEDGRAKLGEELADVLCYAVLVAHRAGIDLEEAVQQKFNMVSERVGSRVYIGDDGDWHLRPVKEPAQ